MAWMHIHSLQLLSRLESEKILAPAVMRHLGPDGNCLCEEKGYMVCLAGEERPVFQDTETLADDLDHDPDGRLFLMAEILRKTGKGFIPETPWMFRTPAGCMGAKKEGMTL